MKLSEAIRLGAMVRPQVHGIFFGTKTLYGINGQYGVLGSCALGAAWEASGGPAHCIDLLESRDEFRARFPILLVMVNPPIGEIFFTPIPIPVPLENVIVALNDLVKWTREQIADWVESVELTQEQKPEEVACAAQ